MPSRYQVAKRAFRAGKLALLGRMVKKLANAQENEQKTTKPTRPENARKRPENARKTPGKRPENARKTPENARKTHGNARKTPGKRPENALQNARKTVKFDTTEKALQKQPKWDIFSPGRRKLQLCGDFAAEREFARTRRLFGNLLLLDIVERKFDTFTPVSTGSNLLYQATGDLQSIVNTLPPTKTKIDVDLSGYRTMILT